MSKAVITESLLSGIASAIRSKTGKTGSLTPAQMAQEIQGIQDASKILDRTYQGAFVSDVTKLGAHALDSCQGITSITLTGATEIGEQATRNCSNCSEMIFPAVETIGYSIFLLCYGLEYVDIGTAARDFVQFAPGDSGNYRFKAAAIRRTDGVPTLQQAYNSDFSHGKLLVPRALVDTYKNATNWAIHSSKIYALEDYTVDGTTTGSLDKSRL